MRSKDEIGPWHPPIRRDASMFPLLREVQERHAALQRHGALSSLIFNCPETVMRALRKLLNLETPVPDRAFGLHRDDVRDEDRNATLHRRVGDEAYLLAVVAL